MQYENVVQGRFLSRPNRFIAVVDIGGTETVCHVKNTGRCRELLVLAVATSIDALAVGVTFSMVELSVSIGLAVALIGCTTFLISLGGVYVGNVFGAKYKNKAEFVGGAILILIGVKVLLEHLLG